MSNIEVNPFQVLYVTDSPDPTAFVKLFSDYPVKNSLPIFEPGNFILKGTQGSGKSMLLNLFRPKIRLAYHSAGIEFPIPESHRRFISAGINLTLSGALDIGQRPIGKNSAEDEELFPLFFADFVNYFVIRDLLSSLALLSTEGDAFDNIVDRTRLNTFAIELSHSDCWFGYLQGVNTFNDLCEVVDKRLSAYRSFHQFNSDLPDNIQGSKTRIGTPLGEAIKILKRTETIQKNIPFFVRIDQLERLYRSDVIRPNLGQEYRRIINKAIGQRDSRVSYRIGTRRYAWDDDLTIYSTNDRLENLRDFRVIDLEEKLRRKEDAKSWVFPDFAEDAFRKRLQNSGFDTSVNADLIKDIFGDVPSPEQAAKSYAGTAKPESILGLKDKDSWDTQWKEFFFSKFNKSPFQAVLAAAWARQSGGGKNVNSRMSEPPPDTEPWKKATWKKERVRQCLMQIAARNGQRLRWSGKDAIIGISSPNISVFLSVCHEIWDVFIRTQQSKPLEKRVQPLSDGIHADIQAVGIQTASHEWYKKITEQPNGHDRQRFIEVMGRNIRKWLIDDTSMSNPGHVGFSLLLDDLRSYPALQLFLDDAADYGDLYDVDHTTKEKNRKKRMKWYLSPILSPHFQIPETHPKEPRYLKINEVVEWINEAGIIIPGLPKTSRSSSNRDSSPTFFDFIDDDEEE